MGSKAAFEGRRRIPLFVPVVAGGGDPVCGRTRNGGLYRERDEVRSQVQTAATPNIVSGFCVPLAADAVPYALNVCHVTKYNMGISKELRSISHVSRRVIEMCRLCTISTTLDSEEHSSTFCHLPEKMEVDTP